MSRKPTLPPVYPDTMTVPPTLPDAAALADCGLPLTHEEFNYVRAAMGMMAVARRPKLVWNGWKLVGGALLLADRYAVKAAGNSTGPAYNRHIGPFLRASGFTFLNAGVRWAARQCAANFEAIDAWREFCRRSKGRGSTTPSMSGRHSTSATTPTASRSVRSCAAARRGTVSEPTCSTTPRPWRSSATICWRGSTTSPT